MTQMGRVIIGETKLALPLGAHVEKDGVRFSICLKKEDMPVYLILYNRETKEEMTQISLEDYQIFDQIYGVEITGVCAQSIAYGYVGKNGNVKDEYAPYVIDHKYLYGLIDGAYEWKYDEYLKQCPKAANDLIYKLHVRGFTKDVSAHVNNPGTFAGVMEKIPYMKDLGVTYVELMPVADFLENCTRKIKGVVAGVPGQTPLTESYVNYWGYGDAQYFAPKASYSCGNLYKDFCAMVDTFHGNGIKVILEFYFIPGTPQSFVLDCLRHWVLNYHVDGFRINDDAAPIDVLLNDPVLSHIILVAGGHSAIGSDRMYRSDDDFQNIMRSFLKGDSGCVNAFINAFTGMDYKGQTINYIASHNGFTLADLVSYNEKHNEANGEDNSDGTDWNFSWNCGAEGDTDDTDVLRLRQKQIRNAFVMLLLSAGTPMIMAGDEFCRSQKGNNNPYCQDNEISWLNWDKLEQHKDLHDFVKMLIQLKNDHPIFHHRKQYVMKDLNASGLPDLSFHGLRPWYVEEDTEGWYIGLMFHGEYAGKNNTFYLAFNMHWEMAKVSLPLPPKGKCWKRVADTAIWPYGQNETLNDNGINIAPRSIVILQSTEKVIKKVD